MYSKYLKNLGPKPTIIDIGAHIGGFALLAANIYPNSNIYCYEPNPDNFRLLKENIIINNFEDTVYPFQLAITGKTGIEKLHIFPGKNTGMHSISKKFKDDNSILINCITLEVFKSNNIGICNFLKIDCEGAEEDILLNTSSNLLKRINYISLEMHFDKTVIGLFNRVISGNK